MDARRVRPAGARPPMSPVREHYYNIRKLMKTAQTILILSPRGVRDNRVQRGATSRGRSTRRSAEDGDAGPGQGIELGHECPSRIRESQPLYRNNTAGEEWREGATPRRRSRRHSVRPRMPGGLSRRHHRVTAGVRCTARPAVGAAGSRSSRHRAIRATTPGTSGTSGVRSSAARTMSHRGAG